MTGVGITLVAFTTQCAMGRGPQALKHSNEGGGYGSNINYSTGLSGSLTKANKLIKNEPLCHETIFTMAGNEKETIIASRSLLPPTKNGNVTPTIMAAAAFGAPPLSLRFLPRLNILGYLLRLVCINLFAF